MKIGFLGLGTMGLPLANNLRRAGHLVTVWNRTADKADALVKKGALLAPTPRAAATGQQLVFTCLSDERALEAVLEGPDGVLAGLKEGDVLVDTSTAGTRSARSVEERVMARGARFLAAPLLGSKGAAEQAQLVMVCGGPAAARDRARPALHAVSARLIELEDPAQAALMKLVINSLGGAMMAGLAEALALGVSGGLEISRIIETIQASSFHSPLYLMKGDQIAQQDWAPRFALWLAEKDQRLAQEAATEQGAMLAVNRAVRQLLGEAIAGGRGDKDLAAVADLVFERSGIKR